MSESAPMATATAGQQMTIREAFHEAARLYRAKRPRRGIQIVSRILERRPDHAAAQHLMGALYMQIDKLDEAEPYIRRAMELQPAVATYWNTYGLWLMHSERVDEALEQFERVIAADPEFAPVHTNIGLMRARRYDYAGAEAAHREAIARDPDYAPAFHNLGNVLKAQSRLDEAMAAFDQALALRPDEPAVLCDRGLCRLLAGDYERGWADYAGRLDLLTERARHAQVAAPMWDGSSFDGKTLLVYQEQGLGDVIQCARYFPAVKARGGTVLFLGSKPLKRLMARADGIDEAIDDVKAVPPVDVKVPIFSLPGLMGTTRDTIPLPGRYLPSEPDVALPEAPGRLKVGLCWAAKVDNPTQRFRSLQPAALDPLLEIPDVAFYSLQFGIRAADLDGARHHDRVVRLDDETLGDLYRTAALVEQLDLVITIDTMTVHLAGALDKPAWLLLNYNSDWRWGRGLDRGLWYPKIRIFRQSVPGDWASPVADAAAALGDALAAPAPKEAL